jgi:hypothetical protein
MSKQVELEPLASEPKAQEPLVSEPVASEPQAQEPLVAQESKEEQKDQKEEKEPKEDQKDQKEEKDEDLLDKALQELEALESGKPVKKPEYLPRDDKHVKVIVGEVHALVDGKVTEENLMKVAIQGAQEISQFKKLKPAERINVLASAIHWMIKESGLDEDQQAKLEWVVDTFLPGILNGFIGFEQRTFRFVRSKCTWCFPTKEKALS